MGTHTGPGACRASMGKEEPLHLNRSQGSKAGPPAGRTAAATPNLNDSSEPPGPHCADRNTEAQRRKGLAKATQHLHLREGGLQVL